MAAGAVLAMTGLALGGAGTAPGQAPRLETTATADTAQAMVRPSVFTSDIWSGYEQTGASHSYWMVSASWTVPTVSSTGTTAGSSDWIGIDGANGDNNLIQTGTEQIWNGAANKPLYRAFYEVLPRQPTSIRPFDVSPGDNIYALIRVESSTTFWIYLLDRNSGQTISTVQTYTGPQASAEFIHEAPEVNGAKAPLAPTTPVTFRDARVNYDGAALTKDQRVIMKPGTTALATPSNPNDERTGFTVSPSLVTPLPPVTPLFQRHADGSVWESTGPFCQSATNCPGWAEVDDNPGTTAISTGGGTVYQLQRDGSVWEWTGGACVSASFCPGWVQLDNNPGTVQISAGNGTVYARHRDGSIWKATGQICNGGSCPGWIELDNNAGTTTIAAGDYTVFQLHADGSVYESTGTACGQNTGCTGWTQLDSNHATTAITAGQDTVYQLRRDGTILRLSAYGWIMVDNNPAATAIAAGGPHLYQLHSDGSVWQSTGAACTGTACPGWTILNGPSTVTALTANIEFVYRQQRDGSIWEGAAGLPWEQLDGNAQTVQISASNGT